VVGKGKNAQYVTYINTLSNALVSGKLVPPSFPMVPAAAGRASPDLRVTSMSNPNSADVVVIGAGVTGALLATRLAKTGKSVLLLESGPRMGRDQLVERFRSSAFKSDFMAPYPYSPLAPHPRYTPEPNGYLQQRGRMPSVRSTSACSAAPAGTGRRSCGATCPTTSASTASMAWAATGPSAMTTWKTTTTRPRSSPVSAARH
jgi:choline dehydrogenase-like flavoprotein